LHRARVIQLAPFGVHQQAGVFLSRMRSLADVAEQRGWRFATVLKPEARRRDWLDDLLAMGIDAHFVPTNPRLTTVQRLRAMLAKTDEPTVLHAHFTGYDVPAALAAVGRSRTAVFWHVHSYLESALWFRVRSLVKYTVARACVDRILCAATHIAEGVIERGAPPAKVTVVPTPLDTSEFSRVTDESRSEARRRLEIPTDRRVVLHFGWDPYIKGTDLFLEALKELRDSGNDRVVGITIGDEAGATRLRDELGVGDVLVLPPQRDIRRFFAAADVFVSAGRSEGSPTAVLEALWVGLPVVATDIPGHADVPNLALYRLAALDARDLARVIGDTLRDGLPRAAEVEKARQWIFDHRDLRLWSKQLLDLYESALSSDSA
jgi:glycosyltransferase involved in cell wall biosynthesis